MGPQRLNCLQRETLILNRNRGTLIGKISFERGPQIFLRNRGTQPLAFLIHRNSNWTTHPAQEHRTTDPSLENKCIQGGPLILSRNTGTLTEEIFFYKSASDFPQEHRNITSTAT